MWRAITIIQRIPHLRRQASVRDASKLQPRRAELGTGANRPRVLGPLSLNFGSCAPRVGANCPQNFPHALPLSWDILGLLY